MFSKQIQDGDKETRELLKKEIENICLYAGRPMEITDEILHDIAVNFMLGILHSNDHKEYILAVAVQLAYVVQNEE